MRELTERVQRHIERHGFMRAGDRVSVAVSGGADSVALLRMLLELREDLGIVLSVVHFNHQIRGAEADADQKFVEDLARENKLELHMGSADTPTVAAAKHNTLEATARALRYGFFRQLIAERTVNRIATAHTQDDQAETVLLRLMRGAGTRGMAGIYPRVVVGAGVGGKGVGGTLGKATAEAGCGEIVRPLRKIRRAELQSYLRGHGQSWREDSSNLDLKHTRNRVRKLLLPLLEKEFNPAIVERLSEMAEIARAEEDYWDAELNSKLGSENIGGAPESKGVFASELLTRPLAVRRRLAMGMAKRLGLSLEFQQVEQILRLAEAPSAGKQEVLLNEEWKVVREANRLHFEATRAAPKQPRNYEYALAVPGELQVNETGTRFRTSVVIAKRVRSSDTEKESQLLKKASLAAPLTVRNWRPGDRFWPAHSKAPKKVKELLQKQKIPVSSRQVWPVVVSGAELVWVRGFPVPAKLAAEQNEVEAVLIEEITLRQEKHRGE